MGFKFGIFLGVHVSDSGLGFGFSGQLMLGSCLALPTLDLICPRALLARLNISSVLPFAHFSAFWRSNETEIQ